MSLFTWLASSMVDTSTHFVSSTCPVPLMWTSKGARLQRSHTLSLYTSIMGSFEFLYGIWLRLDLSELSTSPSARRLLLIACAFWSRREGDGVSFFCQPQRTFWTSKRACLQRWNTLSLYTSTTESCTEYSQCGRSSPSRSWMEWATTLSFYTSIMERCTEHVSKCQEAFIDSLCLLESERGRRGVVFLPAGPQWFHASSGIWLAIKRIQNNSMWYIIDTACTYCMHFNLLMWELRLEC